MRTDRFGLTFSDCDTATAQAVDDFTHGFLAYLPKATNILAAADNAPGHGLANAFAATLWMFLEAPVAAAKARPYLHKAETAKPANDREASIVRIVARWVANDIPALIGACEAHIDAYPRDLVVVKLAQYHLFNTGDSAGMLRVALKAEEAAGDIAHTHAMIAFGYEQCHLLRHAENAARRALDIDALEPWAHHALAHVMLTEGRIAEGAAYLESVAESWQALNSFMRSHNWWHLALFYLSMGRYDDVRRSYDTHVWGLAKDYSQDQVGAVSLLARMDFAGVDVGNRWADVADHVARRGADTTNAFLTLQYLYALCRTGRPEAHDLLAGIEARAEDEAAFDRAVWSEVALPAARGIRAHAAGDWDRAIHDLAIALPRMADCGGSHAQRDLFEQIHLDALIKGGRSSAAQQVLELRRTFDPDGVPLNRMLAEIYTRTGLPTLAKEATARVSSR